MQKPVRYLYHRIIFLSAEQQNGLLRFFFASDMVRLSALLVINKLHRDRQY